MSLNVPDAFDDPVSAVTRYLIASEVATVVGAYLDSKPFIWQDYPQHNLENSLPPLSGTSAAGVVVRGAGSWSPGIRYSRTLYPRIAIDIYADAIRDIDGNVIDPTSAIDLATAVYRAVDDTLHTPDNKVIVMGSIVTAARTRLAAPASYDLLVESDGVYLGTAFYGLVI